MLSSTEDAFNFIVNVAAALLRFPCVPRAMVEQCFSLIQGLNEVPQNGFSG